MKKLTLSIFIFLLFVQIFAVGKTEDVKVYGSKEKWTFENVEIDSNGKKYAESDKPFKTVIGGFEVTAKKSIYDGKNVTVVNGQIKTIEGFEEDFIDIYGLVLSNKKIINGGCNIGEFIFFIDGWKIFFDYYTLTEKGIETNKNKLSFNDEAIKIYCNENGIFPDDNKDLLSSLETIITNKNRHDFIFSAYSNFEKVIIKNNGDVDSLELKVKDDDSDAFIMYEHYCFDLYDTKFVKKNGRYVLESKKNVFTVSDEDELVFGKSILNSDWEFSIEKGTKKNTFETDNNYLIQADEYVFDGNNIIINGKISKKELCTEPVKCNDIILYTDGCVSVNKINGSVNYNYNGWNITCKNFEFGDEKIIFDSNIIKYREIEIDLGKFIFDTDGYLCDNICEHQYQKINIITPDTYIYETRFSKKGLFASILVFTPLSKNNDSDEYDNTVNGINYYSVKLFPDGKFLIDQPVFYEFLYNDSTEFNFYCTSLDEDGLNISDPKIIFHYLDKFTVHANNLKISMDGKVTQHGTILNPQSLWNTTYMLETLDFEDDGIILSGTLFLPNKLPGILSGARVHFDSLKIKYNCVIHDFKTTLQGNYVIPLFDNWSLSLNSLDYTISENTPLVTFNNAELVIPPGFGRSTVEIGKVYFDPIEGKINYQGILEVLQNDSSAGDVASEFERDLFSNQQEERFRNGR